MFMLCLFALLRWIVEHTPFPLQSPPSRNLTHVGRKYSIGSSPLTSFPSMILTYLLFSISPLAVAPLLESFCSLLSCSWEVLQDLGSDHLPILLKTTLSSFFHLNENPLPSIFRKLVGMTLLFTSTLAVLLQRNTPYFLFPLPLLSSLF